MTKIYLLIFIFLLVGIPLASLAWVRFIRAPEVLPPAVVGEYELQIKGDKDCLQVTNDALDNLRLMVPDEYSNVRKYIGIVECVESNSGIVVQENPPRFQAGRQTYAGNYGSMGFSGVLAHEACHSRLYREYLAAHPGQIVPPEVYSQKNGESKCIEVQIKVLEKLGAGTALVDAIKAELDTNYWEQKDRYW